MNYMKVSEFIVKEISKYGTTDAFGIPGGVILPFVYECDSSDIIPHLMYHEQTAGFAACGYAQASGRLGVAYATRGPGICNMFTAVAEAYQESLPVIFITAHGKREKKSGQRFAANQEMDIVESVRSITKFAANIERVEDVIYTIKKACVEATSGRRGPVLIDVNSALWRGDLVSMEYEGEEHKATNPDKAISEIYKLIESSKRPVILIGDGLRHLYSKRTMLDIANKMALPILSSRGAQDLLSGSPYYFGYIGSHGLRYSNFILAKADLIIALGNRLAFPRHSLSFAPIFKKTRLVRIEMDCGELIDRLDNDIVYNLDIHSIGEIRGKCVDIKQKKEWIKVCEKIKDNLYEEDCEGPVNIITEFIHRQHKNITYVCDVGNNEFWFSRAYEK